MRQKEISLNIRPLNPIDEQFDDDHIVTSWNTPLREDAFVLSDDEKVEQIEKRFREIMEILGKIHADGNTVILVTHEEDISLYAHRVIRLRDGVVETDKINANPATSAVTA